MLKNTFTKNEAAMLLWQVQEDLRHGPLKSLADDLYEAHLWLVHTHVPLTVSLLRAKAASIVPFGYRGRLFILLHSSKAKRVTPYVRVQLFIRWVFLNVEPERS